MITGGVEANLDYDACTVGLSAIADARSGGEKVEIVFKDGVGFDRAKLIESVKGRYGQY